MFTFAPLPWTILYDSDILFCPKLIEEHESKRCFPLSILHGNVMPCGLSSVYMNIIPFAIIADRIKIPEHYRLNKKQIKISSIPVLKTNILLNQYAPIQPVIFSFLKNNSKL